MTTVKQSFDFQRGLEPQVENHCSRGSRPVGISSGLRMIYSFQRALELESHILKPSLSEWTSSQHSVLSYLCADCPEGRAQAPKTDAC